MRTVLIPDIHQNISFVKRILEAEENKADRFVFMGDYFDCYEVDGVDTFTAAYTARFLQKTADRLGPKATWLIGNHDLPYCAAYQEGLTVTDPRNPFWCTGYSAENATMINKNLKPSFFQNLQLFATVDKFFVLHAGFHQSHIDGIDDIPEGVAEFWQKKWDASKHEIFNRDNAEDFGNVNHRHWLYFVSYYRGGPDQVSSPIWLDFRCEFEDIPGLPQIVGHTKSQTRPYRCVGGSHCIDGNQHLYATVDSGKLEIHDLW